MSLRKRGRFGLKAAITAVGLAIIVLLNTVVSIYAATEYQWFRTPKYTSLGDGVTLDTGIYKYNLWSKAKWEIRKVGLYNAYLTYYLEDSTGNPTWIANQGQKLTITQSSTVSRTVSNTITWTLGISGDITIPKLSKLKITPKASFTSTNTETYSYTYSAGMGLEYDLSKYKHKSYTIATNGYIIKYAVIRYKPDGKTIKDQKTMYGYYASYGQEVRLVYRY